MIANFQRILFTIATGLIVVDLVWGFYGHFQVDVLAYARLGLLSLGMAAGGLYYQTRRAEPALASIMFWPPLTEPWALTGTTSWWRCRIMSCSTKSSSASTIWCCRRSPLC